jgi:hypothetical protein
VEGDGGREVVVVAVVVADVLVIRNGVDMTTCNIQTTKKASELLNLPG